MPPATAFGEQDGRCSAFAGQGLAFLICVSSLHFFFFSQSGVINSLTFCPCHCAVMEKFATVAAIESLFRDAYTILEEIHGAADQMEGISSSIVQSHRTIQMLERIHKDQVRSQTSDAVQDTFGLRKNLDSFIATCNAFNYTVKNKPVVSTYNIGCMSPATPTWKRKQSRELQGEFWEHAKTLSLALANAVLLVP